MSKGQKISQKPEWFDLNKYSSISEFSANEWAYQLHHRAFLMECFSSVLNKWDEKLEQWVVTLDSHDVASETWDIRDETLFERITDNPILLKVDEYSVDANKLFFSKSKGSHEKLFHSNLKPLTCDTVFKLYSSMSKNMKSNNITHALDSKYTPVDNAIGLKEGARSGIVNLSIDLNSYDSELISNFKEYLKSARELYFFPEGEGIKKGTLKRMDVLNVLPYIDLQLWAKHTGTYITREVIGKWLFPNAEFDLAEKIKTGTMPLAIRALNYDFISVLTSSDTMGHFSDKKTRE